MSKNISLTSQIADFVSAIQYQSIPEKGIDAAIKGTADCFAVMIAGATEPAPQQVRATIGLPRDKSKTAPIFPDGELVDAGEAALVNGTAAHVLDYDDVAVAGHPSAVLAPAIFAEGWALDCSGEDAVTAYVAGYEAWALLEEWEPGHLHDRGFHPTAVWGGIATAAACARLHRLSGEQTRNAIGLGASMAAGLVANFGSMTKSFHAGRTAQAGIMAARLAKGGFTSSPDVMEHRTGFMMAHSASGQPKLRGDEVDLGRNWRIEACGVNIKRYPTCYATHRSIDALTAVVTHNNLAAQDIEKIEVFTGETQLLMLRNKQPQTGLEAKFSMEFAMACAAIQRNVGLSELTDVFVQRSDVQQLMKKVVCTTTKEFVKDWDQPFSPYDEIKVHLKNGSVLISEQVTRPKGSWDLPMSRDEFKTKFIDCVSSVVGLKKGNELFEQLIELPQLKKLRSITI